MSIHRPGFALLLAAALGLIAQAAQAVPFSRLFVLGDSLSDSGNVFLATGGAISTPPFAPIPSLPYAGGRFSNGPVWVEDLAGMLGLRAAPSLAGGTNYAFGGARTGPLTAGPSPSLLAQGAALRMAHPGGLPRDALYVVWGGANDVRDALTSADPLAAVNTAAADVGTVVRDLLGAGAGTILVPNVPDLGLAPAARAAGASAGATRLSAAFDALLGAELGTLRAANPDARIMGLDVFGLTDRIAANPTVFGLTDVTDPCLRFGVADPAAAVCSDPSRHLFWDAIHPTAAAHRILASAARTAIPEPGTVFLIALGAAAAWGRSRRRARG